MSKSIERLVLERALTLLQAGFSQRTYARDKKGRKVDWSSGKAVKFCATGAIRRATWELTGEEQGVIAQAVTTRLGRPAHDYDEAQGYLVWKNDFVGKKWVVRRFKKRLAHV